MDEQLKQFMDVVHIIPVVHVDVRDLTGEEVAPSIGEYSVDARVSSVFATVCTEFTLSNPNGRVMEGELEFPLPDNAVICGYAIDIDGVMVEGRVVEKEKARIAFENEVKKGVDPGLVEQVKGNLYRTRVYPIPAHGSRRIRVIYTTPLDVAPNGDAALFLPMPQHKLSKRDVKIAVEMTGAAAPVLGGLGDRRFEQAVALWQVESHETDVKPDDHLIVGMPALPAAVGSVENCDGDIYFAASVNVAEVAGKDSFSDEDKKSDKHWRILWDASGSRINADIEAGIGIISQLPESADYQLYVFRNSVEPVQSYSKVSALIEALRLVPCDGGTNLGALADLASQPFDGTTLLFSDGLDTFSGKLPDFVSSIVGFMSGTKRDAAALNHLCGGRVFDASRPITNIVQKILHPSPVVTAVRGTGLSDIEGIGLAAEGRVTVLGRMMSQKCDAVIAISDGREFTVTLSVEKCKTGRTLATAWAANRINELSANADDNRESLLALGRHFSIVSPVSSMIVFERLDQWLEYNIEPPESLKEMHAAWIARHPSDAQLKADEEAARTRWEREIRGLWDNRVKWWEDPVPKNAFPKSGLFDADSEVAFGMRGLARSAVAAVGNAMNSVVESVSGALSRGKTGARREMHEDSAARAGGSVSMRERRAAPRADLDEDVCCFEDACADYPVSGVICEPACECCREAPEPEPRHHAPEPPKAAATISIQAWDPKTPYLTAIKDARSIFKDKGTMYREYLKQREKYSASPAFYLDCAGFFFNEKQNDLAIRILSNLAELKLEDTALLRVYAWRLREAGELDASIDMLRKIIRLRPDEAVSWRDLALTLTIRAKKNLCAADAAEALECFKKAAFDPWKRSDAKWTSLVSLEEFNALATWCEKQKWPDGAPAVPEIDSFYRKNLDTDLRIVMMWDADSTDIDLHVLEPSGEEIYFQHQRSQTGGLLSFDVTTGYGPEEFMHKCAPKGVYKILAHYFASHQQKLTGAVTVTVTVFTDWARDNETSQILSLRLEKAKDKAIVGKIEVG